MRPVIPCEFATSDLLVGEGQRQQGVPSGGHRAGVRQTA